LLGSDSCADDSDTVRQSFRKHDYHGSLVTRLANTEKAILAFGVVRVRHREFERIGEYAARLIEGDTVLREVRCRLVRVPFEVDHLRTLS